MSATALLAEIAGVAEAEAAIDAGVDFVAAPAALAGALVDEVGGRCRTAVTAGTAEEATAAWGSGVELVLLDGAAPPPPRPSPQGKGRRIASPAGMAQPASASPLSPQGGGPGWGAEPQLAAVFHADRTPDLSRLPALAEAGYASAIMTVSPTSTDRLLRHAGLAMLQDFALACRRHGLAPGFGGRLELPDVPRLLLLDPALLCVSGRPTRLRQFRALMTPDEPADDTRTDRIFVHDMVLPMRIGAYAHERTAAQSMRFSVDALVTRARAPIRDMRDIISYDIISDSIRLLVASEHVELVEVLAERIAAAILSHRRVVEVSVVLEKLETGSGVVGVAITRTRDDMGEPQ